MISINEAMMSLLNKCDIDYKSLQDTVLPLWLDKYIEVGIEKREDVNCYTYFIRIILEMKSQTTRWLLIKLEIW